MKCGKMDAHRIHTCDLESDHTEVLHRCEYCETYFFVGVEAVCKAVSKLGNACTKPQHGDDVEHEAIETWAATQPQCPRTHVDEELLIFLFALRDVVGDECQINPAAKRLYAKAKMRAKMDQ